jgi:hypothetical protein
MTFADPRLVGGPASLRTSSSSDRQHGGGDPAAPSARMDDPSEPIKKEA